MAVSQQPVDGFSPGFESRWICMSSIYINIYKNLAHLLEVQESKPVVLHSRFLCGSIESEVFNSELAGILYMTLKPILC
jgi:hypothetical protein